MGSSRCSLLCLRKASNWRYQKKLLVREKSIKEYIIKYLLSKTFSTLILHYIDEEYKCCEEVTITSSGPSSETTISRYFGEYKMIQQSSGYGLYQSIADNSRVLYRGRDRNWRVKLSKCQINLQYSFSDVISKSRNLFQNTSYLLTACKCTKRHKFCYKKWWMHC